MSYCVTLCQRRLPRCAIFKHYRNAILNRIVAATTIAMQPCMQGAVGTCGERVVAHRANEDFEQNLGKHWARPPQSLDQSLAGGLVLTSKPGHLP